MLMKGSTEDKNHNPILHFTWIISPYFFHKMLFSLSCLGVQVVLDYKFWLLVDNIHLWSILRFQRLFFLSITASLLYYRLGHFFQFSRASSYTFKQCCFNVYCVQFLGFMYIYLILVLVFHTCISLKLWLPDWCNGLFILKWVIMLF